MVKKKSDEVGDRGGNSSQTPWRAVQATTSVYGTQCELYHCQPGKGASFPQHVHEEYQIYLNHDLPYRYNYRGERFVVPSKTLCAFQPGEAHGGEDVGEREGASRFRVLYVGSDLMKTFFAETEARHAPLVKTPVTDDARAVRLFTQAHQALLIGGGADRLETDTALMQMARRILWSAAAPPAPDFAGTRRRENQRAEAVRQIKSFLHEHHARNVTLADLVAECHLSGPYLHHAFCQRVGLPPHAYLLNIRIGRAKASLLRGNPLQQVAREVGFADQSHFTRCFRRLVGVTPKQYACKSVTSP